MWFSRGRLLGLVVLLGVGWWWFLGAVFLWGDSIRGVALSVSLLSVAGLLTLGWRGGLTVALACLLALVQGLWGDNSWARQQWLFHSKLEQIRRGRLSYIPEWGWVDRRHSLAELWDPLITAHHESFDHIFFGSWGRAFALRIRATAKDWREASSGLQQIGERCEAEEQRLPWYLASRLSAYNADDLPSVYLTIFRRAYPEVQFSQSPAEPRWWSEGRQLVQRRVRSWRDFEPAQPELRERYRALFEELERKPLPLSIVVEEL